MSNKAIEDAARKIAEHLPDCKDPVRITEEVVTCYLKELLADIDEDRAVEEIALAWENVGRGRHGLPLYESFAEIETRPCGGIVEANYLKTKARAIFPKHPYSTLLERAAAELEKLCRLDSEKREALIAESRARRKKELSNLKEGTLKASYFPEAYRVAIMAYREAYEEDGCSLDDCIRSAINAYFSCAFPDKRLDNEDAAVKELARFWYGMAGIERADYSFDNLSEKAQKNWFKWVRAVRDECPEVQAYPLLRAENEALKKELEKYRNQEKIL